LKRNQPFYHSNHDEYFCRCDNKGKRCDYFKTLMGKTGVQHQNHGDEQYQQHDEDADYESV
jgi:hypothetical protein